VAKHKHALVRLSDLDAGQQGDFFALLADRTRGARKDGKPYYTCRFTDGKRTAVFMVWSDGPWFEDCEAAWKEGQFYKIRAGYEEHPTYGPQLDLHNIRPVSNDDKSAGFEPLDFVPRTVFDIEAMYQELWGLAETMISDVPLRRLVLTLLTKTAKQLKRVPASVKHYFPFAGGLLEHTLSVTHSCMHLVDKYLAHYPDFEPPLNRDLVVAAAILHDLGRTREFSEESVGPEKTVPGQIYGHILLARDLVRETAKELGDVDPELLELLEHIILSHLTLPEWGSPRLPLVPEVLILHHADDLDAKLEMYIRCLSRDQEPGPFTARDPVLGKSLLKRRK
jgi:3'-5' exoribonuclease